MKQRVCFRSARELYHADTCEPLKQAARQGGVRLAALGRGGYPGDRLPKGDLKELCMAGYWDAPADQDWGLDWHCNEGIEIAYVAAGRLPFAVGGKSVQMKAGDLTITRPWQRHRVGNPHVTASHYSWLILDVGVRRPNQPWQWPKWLLSSKADLKRLTDMLRQNEQPVWRADPKIARCFERFDEAVAGGAESSGPARLKIVINELIILLAEMLESRDPQLDVSLSSSERTVLLFLENLKYRIDEPWTLDSMAAACGLGRTHFASYCKKLANIPPVEFLTRCRLDAATRLLEDEPAMSVTEIAFRSGFQSSQYFSKVFRGCHGRTPSDHRRRALRSAASGRASGG